MRTSDQVEKAVKSAKGSLAVEGLSLNSKQEQLVKDQLLGQISHKVFVEKALELSINE